MGILIALALSLVWGGFNAWRKERACLTKLCYNKSPVRFSSTGLRIKREREREALHNMIIRCGHLFGIGVLKHQCCYHCHGTAGCVMKTLPGGHKAIYCCARTTPFTPQEIETILANIPRWEALLVNPKYHSRLRREYEKAQTRLRSIKDLMLDAHVEFAEEDLSSFQLHIAVEQISPEEGAE